MGDQSSDWIRLSSNGALSTLFDLDQNHSYIHSASYLTAETLDEICEKDRQSPLGKLLRQIGATPAALLLTLQYPEHGACIDVVVTDPHYVRLSRSEILLQAQADHNDCVLYLSEGKESLVAGRKCFYRKYETESE